MAIQKNDLAPINVLDEFIQWQA